MSDPIDRVKALMARALDGGASEEEQRTSAVIAVRMIREHELLRAPDTGSIFDWLDFATSTAAAAAESVPCRPTTAEQEEARLGLFAELTQLRKSANERRRRGHCWLCGVKVDPRRGWVTISDNNEGSSLVHDTCEQRASQLINSYDDIPF